MGWHPPYLLKETAGTNPRRVVQHAQDARRKASKAGYSDVETHIKASKLTIEQIRQAPDFRKILEMPNPGGSISAVEIYAKDGVLRIVDGTLTKFHF